jgi:3-oxoacyl-[acyl-carrier protein] reductase
MDLNFTGKCALVAGGSTGIGLATAEILLREGCRRVVIASRSAAKLEAAAAALQAATGRRPETLACDATRPEQVAALIAHLGAGPLDILVSAFGGSFRSGFEALEDAQWLANYELNVLGTVRVLRAALPLLRQAETGRVVLLGATSARQPSEHQIVSNTHKAALLALTKTLSNELAPGITVNCVCPGRVLTPLAESRMRQRAMEAGVSLEAIIAETAATIPLGRLGTAEETANMVAFLASDAASYVTSQSILVDGGLGRAV